MEFKIGDRVRLLESCTRYSQDQKDLYSYGILIKKDNQFSEYKDFRYIVNWYSQNDTLLQLSSNVFYKDHGKFKCEIEKIDWYTIEDIENNLNKLEQKFK